MSRLTGILLAGSIFFLSPLLHAQEDWQKILSDSDSSKKEEKVFATFKTTRIINAQSVEMVKKRTLDFRVAHKFGAMGKAYGGNFHNLYGFDATTDIRIAFEYGITDFLNIGLSRSKARETWQGFVKYRVMQQSKSLPFTMVIYTDANYTPEEDLTGIYSESKGGQGIHRMNYTTQFLIARKFSPALSFQLMPMMVHRNYVADFRDDNDLIALGAGGRIKLTKRFSIIFDYYQIINEFRMNDTTGSYYMPFGAGVEIETGGHVFSIMVTNASFINESLYIPYTLENFFDGGVHFFFNISRNFRL